MGRLYGAKSSTFVLHICHGPLRTSRFREAPLCTPCIQKPYKSSPSLEAIYFIFMAFEFCFVPWSQNSLTR